MMGTRREGTLATRTYPVAWGALALLITSCSDGPTAPEGDTRDIPTPTPDLVALDRMAPGESWQGRPGGLVSSGVPTVTAVQGKIGIISISMSNGQQEFATYIDRWDGHSDIDPAVVLVNCARGGNALESWLSKQSLWDDCRDRIGTAGLTPDQVRVVWAKNADQNTSHGRTLPDPEADYYDLVDNISELSQRIEEEFPAVQAVFHTSRIYAGWAAAQASRGEPISYEGGFAINEVVSRFNSGDLTGTPWLGWGPYLWANGQNSNAQGISWEPDDFRDGGTNHHPSDQGRAKVADALHTFFMQFGWYRG